MMSSLLHTQAMRTVGTAIHLKMIPALGEGYACVLSMTTKARSRMSSPLKQVHVHDWVTKFGDFVNNHAIQLKRINNYNKNAVKFLFYVIEAVDFR